MTAEACFIDLKKAFYTLDHEIFLVKFENYGYTGKINELLRSFPTDREQYVGMNDLETKRFSIRTGVSQCLVLNPFLFVTYNNDIPDVPDKAEITMFADDTKLVKSSIGTQYLLSSVMKSVCGWFWRTKWLSKSQIWSNVLWLWQTRGK